MKKNKVTVVKRITDLHVLDKFNKPNSEGSVFNQSCFQQHKYNCQESVNFSGRSVHNKVNCYWSHHNSGYKAMYMSLLQNQNKKS